ncbi:restriction endonuclease subunit S [Variovorax sp. Root473]|uniref:restriction endonuclease subunit S n=1 Tax=Variovorax sp. Root473 TaxID=1736541 RepID=UPI0009E7B618|nr:restriction endonuclease subunit S [Variovorax sp. Root473]
MSSEWSSTTIGEQATLQRGFDITKATQKSGSVPVVSSAGVGSRHDTAMAKAPGVVLGRKGVVGSVHFISEDYWPHDTTLWVKDFHGNAELFVYYFFLAHAKDLSALDVGSANPTLNRNHVHPIRVMWPPRSEQVEIGNVLAALDNRIALLRETNATLEAIAQALFKSWVVDFDPVRAKMEGREPDGMDEAIAALFPNEFDASELGRVPRGWTVSPIGDVVSIAGGATPDTKNSTFWREGVHPWTTPKDLSGLATPVLLDTERKLSPAGLSKIGSGLLPRRTLLLSSRAPIGYLALTEVPLAINQGYIAMTPGGRLPPLYLLFWCRQNMEVIKARANGSTFMEISKKAFRPIPVLVPPQPVVEAFMAVAEAIFERLVENEKQAQTLASLRDGLLPRLISGQLRLPDFERDLSEPAIA